ncbi:hypothetical protein BS78_04G129400 [Paspalum vaginatum]|nr:hypothetical protein BS78_04G129400 [Paspalum vaginatum]
MDLYSVKTAFRPAVRLRVGTATSICRPQGDRRLRYVFYCRPREEKNTLFFQPRTGCPVHFLSPALCAISSRRSSILLLSPAISQLLILFRCVLFASTDLGILMGTDVQINRTRDVVAKQFHFILISVVRFSSRVFNVKSNVLSLFFYGFY